MASDYGPVSSASGRAPKVWGHVPPRNKNFTGRDDILELLRERLINTSSVTVLPHALQGMGGVGKTQVAIEYAYRHAAEYDLVWWIPADQPPLVRASLAALAPQVDVPPTTASGIEASAAAVLDALRMGRPFSRWLLVFDNADQPEDLSDIIPQGPGHVLITSRNYRWESRADTVQVDVFTPEESIAFLERRIRSGLDRKDANALAAELGYLPLALEQAGALQAETGMPIEEYLRLLKEHAVRIMAEGKSPDYPLSMTAAWKLSVSTLEQYQAEALELLRCCAFMGSEPIPRDLFPRSAHALQPPLRDLLSDPIRLSRAIRELGRFALIRIEGRTWHIHRLTQALLRDDLPSEEQDRYREQAQLVLAVGAPQEPTNDRNWPRYGELVAHVAADAVQLDQSEDPTVRHFATDMVRYLYESGDFAAARGFAERFIAAWTPNPNIPEGDLQLLRVRRHRANVLRALGQFDAAYAEDEAILQISIRTFGDRDSFTLQLTNSFGANLRARGDFAEALDSDLRSYEAHKEVLGTADQRTLRAANNLAVDYGLNSRYPESRDLHNETYRLRSEGPSDIPAQELLSSLGGLARALRLCGDYSAARDVGQEAYDFGTATLGVEHPRTIEVAIDLSIALRRVAVSYNEATELAGTIYQLCRARLGQSAPLTVAAVVSLTNIQRTSSQIADALKMSREAAEEFGRLFGRDHPYYYGCLGNLALLERVNGNAERALQLNEQARDGLEARLGLDHHYTLTVSVNLASDLAGIGQNERACRLGEGSLRRLQHVLGEEHPHTLGCAANLVIDLRAAGHTKEADEFFTKTLAQYRATLGNDHPDTAAAAEGRRLDFDFDSPQI
jgi:hypothetical protein